MRGLDIFLSVFFEGFFIVGAGLSIIGIRPKLKKIAFIGFICGLVLYGVRLFYEIKQIPLGTHSFVIIILFTLVLKYIGKQKWSASIIAILVSFLLVTLGEGVFMFNIIKLLNITMEDILNNPGLRLMATVLSDIFLIIVFITGYFFKISAIDLNRLNENEEV